MIDLLLQRRSVCFEEKLLSLDCREELQRDSHRMVCGAVFWQSPGVSVDRLIMPGTFNDRNISESNLTYF